MYEKRTTFWRPPTFSVGRAFNGSGSVQRGQPGGHRIAFPKSGRINLTVYTRCVCDFDTKVRKLGVGVHLEISAVRYIGDGTFISYNDYAIGNVRTFTGGAENKFGP